MTEVDTGEDATALATTMRTGVWGLRGRVGSFNLARLLQSGLWSFCDQALISSASLVTMVLLVRALDPSAFGVFTLLYSGLLFLNSLQLALITQPYSVIGATRQGEEFARYTHGLFIVR